MVSIFYQHPILSTGTYELAYALLLRWISSFLRDRTVIVRILGHTSREIAINYGPSTSTLIRLYKSFIRSLFDYGAPATCVSSPNIQRSWERIQTHFISRARSIPPFHPQRQKTAAHYLPRIHDRTLYLAQLWYRRAMQHNRGVQDYIDNHIHNKRINCGARTTPLELIRK